MTRAQRRMDAEYRAAEAELTEATPIDRERMAAAIQSTILTSPDRYMGPGMGAYRKAWSDLTDAEKRHVLRDAEALIAAYDELRLCAGHTIYCDDRCVRCDGSCT
jgi:hypothetical protein